MTKYILFLILIFSPVSYSIPCYQLNGSWVGYWQTTKNQRHRAKLSIDSKNKIFSGTFKLINATDGQFNGSCNSTLDGLILTLKKDPPYFNPCRGMLIKDRGRLLLHFFCFSPNEFGYFFKSGFNLTSSSEDD